MSFRIRATTLIVIWSSTASVLSSWLQKRGNSRVMFPKLPSLYVLRQYRRYVLLFIISRLFSLKKIQIIIKLQQRLFQKCLQICIPTCIVVTCILFYNPKFFFLEINVFDMHLQILIKGPVQLHRLKTRSQIFSYMNYFVFVDRKHAVAERKVNVQWSRGFTPLCSYIHKQFECLVFRQACSSVKMVYVCRVH